MKSFETNRIEYKEELSISLEMIEQLGSGVPRILKAYSKDNFIFMEHFIRMKFPAIEPVYDEGSQKSSQKSSQKTTVIILQLIKKNPVITTDELAKEIGITRRAIAKQISKLKEQDKLKRIGTDKGGHWEVIEK